MNQEQLTQYSEIRNELIPQLFGQTPTAIVDAIATQMFTASEARERINREGSVVRDMGGKVIAHPAIKIEADAMKIYIPLLQKHSPGGSVRLR